MQLKNSETPFDLTDIPFWKEFIYSKEQERLSSPACEIYYGLCYCKENCIAESKCNMATRWTEHDSPTHDFESAKHLNRHIQHSYNLITLTKASKNTRKRKNLEAIYIALLRLSLRDKLKFYKLLHFRNYKFSNHYNSYFWYLSRQSFYQMKKKSFFNWYSSLVMLTLCLIHYSPVLLIYTPWKHQKT